MRAKGTRDGTEEYVDRGAARVFRSVLVEAETKDFAGSRDGHVVIAGRNPDTARRVVHLPGRLRSAVLIAHSNVSRASV